MSKRMMGLAICIAAFAVSAVAQTVTGSGTSGTVPVFTGSSTVGNSVITQSGSNVGIGTTNPSSPLSLVGPNNPEQFQIQSTSSGGHNWGIASFGTYSGFNTGGLGFGDYTAGQWRMYIDGSGNVGIGTTGPTTVFDVAGARANPSLTVSEGILRIYDKANLSTGLDMGIFPNSPYGTWIQSDNTPISGGGAFPLALNPLGGNVGIGTTNPAGQFSDNSINYGDLGYGLSAGSFNWVHTAADPGWNNISSAGNNGLVVATDQATGVTFQVSSGAYNASIAQRPNHLFTVLGSGNVGIGTTTPAYKLDVAGAIRSSSGGIVFPDGSTQTTANANVISGNNVITQVNGNVGIGTMGPTTVFDVAGATANPSLTVSEGILRIYDKANLSTGLDMGIFPNSPYGTWIQSDNTPISGGGAFPLALNPLGGNVGIGTTSPGAMLEVNGNLKLTSGSGASITFADGTTQSTAYTGVICGGDYAESVDVTGSRTNYEPGDVLVIDPNAPGKFLKSNQPYSTLVTGIYSTKPGTVGRRQTTAKSPDEVPMAMMGIVPTKVTAENGPIKPGDLLVASSTLGRAMKGTDRSQLTGAVIGKALGSLDSGTGVIEVVVTLQ